jgi:hypothetical protein
MATADAVVDAPSFSRARSLIRRTWRSVSASCWAISRSPKPSA